MTMRIILLFALVFASSVGHGQSSGISRSVTSADGTRIVYQVEGSGPTIVFLHGLGGDKSSWGTYGYPTYLQDYRLILVDARGHGASGAPDEPAGFALQRFVEDLEAIVREETDSPPIFWGYSLGAVVGFHVLLHNPNLFSRYILGDGMYGIYGPPPDQRSSVLASIQTLRLQESRAHPNARKSIKALADFLELDRTSESEDIRSRLGPVAKPTFIYRSGETREELTLAEQRTNFYFEPLFESLEVLLFPSFTHAELFGRSQAVVPPILEFIDSGNC